MPDLDDLPIVSITNNSQSYPTIIAKWAVSSSEEEREFVIDFNNKIKLNLSTGTVAVPEGMDSGSKQIWEFVSSYCHGAMIELAEEKHRELAKAYLKAEKKIAELENKINKLNDQLKVKDKLIKSERFTGIGE